MLENVGIKIYITLKSAVSAVLKGVFKNLIKPYIKSYIDQKEVLKGGIVPLYHVVRTSRRHCTFFLA